MSSSTCHVAVLGGGLAGMSAAVALAQAGFRITVLEKRATLGGRAGSHQEATSGEWVDNCQHVLMPCCTNLLDFYRRIGVQEDIRFYPFIPFLDSNGKVSFLNSSSLPAPLHCAPSFLALNFLSLADKLRIARGLCALISLGERAGSVSGTALDWLLEHGQSRQTIECFWQPVLVSALNEDLDRASLLYASKVFLNAFLSHPRGWWLGIPTVPLSILYGDPLPRMLEKVHGQTRMECEIESLIFRERKIVAAQLAGGERISADFVVIALPWRAAAEIIPRELRPEASDLSFRDLSPSPITGVHVWFDRPVTDLDFAALPGKQVHWFFNKSRIFYRGSETGTYLQLVTSASRAWMELTKSQILDIALRELREVLPEVGNAHILKSYVLKEPAATFSPTAENEHRRPLPATTIENLFLAGDWIKTGWPATMEGAVRGGYLAAEAVLRATGLGVKVLVPDLPPSGLMRFLKHRLPRSG